MKQKVFVYKPFIYKFTVRKTVLEIKRRLKNLKIKNVVKVWFHSLYSQEAITSGTRAVPKRAVRVG